MIDGKYEYMVYVQCMTYQHALYITDALNGFNCQQTDFPFVCVVMDDASTDGEQDVIRNFIQSFCVLSTIKEIELDWTYEIHAISKDNPNCHFVFYLQKINLYGTGKRTPIFNYWESQCKYIALCEGDDYWTDPHKLQKQVDFLDTHPEYGLCYTDYNTYYHSTSIIQEACFANGYSRVPNSFAEHLIAQGYIAPMTWLYRVDVFYSFKDSIPKAPTDGTYVYALEFFLHSKVYFLDEVTATYRVSEGTASRPSTAEKMIKYRKGVYAIQQQYALRTSETAGYAPIFKANEVLELLPLALDEHLDKYIDEYIAKANGLHLSVDTCITLYQMKNEVRKARSSYAYRLGKFLLRPFSFIRQHISK